MKLSDVSHGPDWIAWVAFALFVVLSIVLISGHGSFFIAGYNTASKEEKAKYDEKKLCRTVGAGMAVIAVLMFVGIVWEEVLPAGFASVMAGAIAVDVLIILVLGNTVCRKSDNTRK